MTLEFCLAEEESVRCSPVLNVVCEDRQQIQYLAATWHAFAPFYLYVFLVPDFWRVVNGVKMGDSSCEILHYRNK